MRKTVLTGIIVLLIASMAMAQAPQTPAAGQGQPSQAPATGQAAPQQKKEIKDPAEYNAYMAAVQANDPNQKAASLEGFLNQYPNSVMKTDALEMLMGTYQQTGNVQKVQDTAQKILQADPKNTSALAVMSFLLKAKIQQEANNPPQMQADVQQAQQYAQSGLQALQTQPCPEGASPADCDKRKTQLSGIFNSTLGFSYLQQKDYANAAKFLTPQVQANPQDLESTYQLALALLEPKPINPQGLWYGARAVNLAASNPQAHDAIDKYVKNRYIRYHGDDSGYQELLQQAAASPQPPAGFQVAPAPTPAELAAKLVQSKQVNQMSFDEIQLILTSGNQQAADQVWTQIKDKPIALLGKLISGTADTLQIAGSADDIEQNKPDIELKMVGPIPAREMPKPGDLKFQGKPTSYDPNPFMVHMTEGTLIGATKAAPSKAPAKRAVPKKKKK
jgi:hypothetical protein